MATLKAVAFPLLYPLILVVGAVTFVYSVFFGALFGAVLHTYFKRG